MIRSRRRRRVLTTLLAALACLSAPQTTRAEDASGRRDDLVYGQAIDPKGSSLESMLVAWERVLKEPIVVDPAVAGTTIRLLRPDAPLSWGAFKQILDLLEAVVQEVRVGSEWVMFVHARRTVATRIGPPSHVLRPGEPIPDRDEVVTAIFPILDGNGDAIFQAVRPKLAFDANRVANLLYFGPPTNSICVIDFAPNADYYAKVIRSLDVPADDARRKVPAAPEERRETKKAAATDLDQGAALDLEGLSTGLDVATALETWSKHLNAGLAVDPAFPATKIKVITSGKLTWGVFKRILAFHELAIEEREETGKWTIHAYGRRNLPGAKLTPRVVTAAHPVRSPDEIVSMNVPIENGAIGMTLLVTLRGLLVRDRNGIGSIAYDAPTRTFNIVDFATNALHHANLIDALDTRVKTTEAPEAPRPRKPGGLGVAAWDSNESLLTVKELRDGGAAQKAGLEVGDKIHAMAVRTLTPEGPDLPRVRRPQSSEELVTALKGCHEGETVVLRVEREGEMGALSVVLGAE